MKQEYSNLATIAVKEKSSYEQYLSMLANVELEYKQELRLKRLLRDARLPTEKSLENYDFDHVEGIEAREVSKLITGEFIEKNENVVLYGDIGVGKTHLAVGLVRKLCERGYKCQYMTTSALIERLQEAKQGLTLANLWKKLDRYNLIVCDELGYIPQNKEGADLFFQFISQRYERRSTLITTNLAYSQWDQVFLDEVTTAAAVDRIIHHCQTYNVRGPSWRRSQAGKTASK